MIFAANKIPNELQRIVKFLVEFLNVPMNPTEVLAPETKQYTGQGLKTLIPRLLGQRAEPQQKTFSAMRIEPEWDELTAFTFFRELEEVGSDHLSDIVRSILRWADSEKLYIYPEQDIIKSFILILLHKEKSYQLLSVQSSGLCEICFQYTNKSPFDAREKRIELLNRLNSIEGLSISLDAIYGRSRISLSVLKNEAAIKRFLEVFTWVVEEIKGLKQEIS
jgi:hypothetical protein